MLIALKFNYSKYAYYRLTRYHHRQKSARVKIEWAGVKLESEPMAQESAESKIELEPMMRRQKSPRAKKFFKFIP
ncbi:hypothetical protein BpHYR1_039987 [Brachionus plicatilis]|uniref:Uncharacterized protein n=1 Tax=Brachionus plicatilis TaxID=10195 RepID=A0A3M7SJ07_BRAPC|nr:hypothetical protein BpHYR1_039987 [Brachionus plicatilis]